MRPRLALDKYSTCDNKHPRTSKRLVTPAKMFLLPLLVALVPAPYKIRPCRMVQSLRLAAQAARLLQHSTLCQS
jgi:hypothetical protein